MVLHHSAPMSAPLRGVLRALSAPLREGDVLAHLRKIQEALWSGDGGEGEDGEMRPEQG